jgi:hypothetical protein
MSLSVLAVIASLYVTSGRSGSRAAPPRLSTSRSMDTLARGRWQATRACARACVRARRARHTRRATGYARVAALRA